MTSEKFLLRSVTLNGCSFGCDEAFSMSEVFTCEERRSDELKILILQSIKQTKWFIGVKLQWSWTMRPGTSWITNKFSFDLWNSFQGQSTFKWKEAQSPSDCCWRCKAIKSILSRFSTSINSHEYRWADESRSNGQGRNSVPEKRVVIVTIQSHGEKGSSDCRLSDGGN